MKNCRKGYTINPNTGRCIKVGGPTWIKCCAQTPSYTPSVAHPAPTPSYAPPTQQPLCLRAKITANVDFKKSITNPVVTEIAYSIRDRKDIPFELFVKFINLPDHDKIMVADFLVGSENFQKYKYLFDTTMWSMLKKPHHYFDVQNNQMLFGGTTANVKCINVS